MAPTSEQPTGDLNPDQLMQMGMSYTSSHVLAAGVQLDVFSPLVSGPKTAADLARSVGASERGLRMLLDALTGLRLLTKDGGRYQLTSAAAQYLVRSSPDYLGAILEDNSLGSPGAIWSRPSAPASRRAASSARPRPRSSFRC